MKSRVFANRGGRSSDSEEENGERRGYGKRYHAHSDTDTSELSDQRGTIPVAKKKRKRHTKERERITDRFSDSNDKPDKVSKKILDKKSKRQEKKKGTKRKKNSGPVKLSEFHVDRGTDDESSNDEIQRSVISGKKIKLKRKKTKEMKEREEHRKQLLNWLNEGY